MQIGYQITLIYHSRNKVFFWNYINQWYISQIITWSIAIIAVVNLIIIYSNTNSLDTCEHKDIIKSTGWWEIARKRTQIQNYIAFHLPFHVYLSSLLFKLLVAARICVPHNLENHVLLHLSRKENWVFEVQMLKKTVHVHKLLTAIFFDVSKV